MVPVTPDFRAQCGAILCDRVIADFSAVKGKPLNEHSLCADFETRPFDATAAKQFVAPPER